MKDNRWYNFIVLKSLPIDSEYKQKYNKKFKFPYLSRKDFEDYQQAVEHSEKTEDLMDGSHVQAIGYIQLRKIKESDKCDKVVCIVDNKPVYFKFNSIDKQNELDSKNIVGYLCVENGSEKEWVAIKGNWFFFFFFLLALLIAIALLARSCNTPVVEERDPLKIADGTEIVDEQREAVVETIDIPGYMDMNLNSEKPAVNLTNPKGNTVYFIYHLFEGDNEFYSTDAIKPGEMVTCDVKSLLGEGTHRVLFQIDTYDVETESVCNGAKQEVSVTIN